MPACMQDVVWEKLDAIDGDTVFVSSALQPPGEIPSIKIPQKRKIPEQALHPHSAMNISQQVSWAAECCQEAAHVANVAAAQAAACIFDKSFPHIVFLGENGSNNVILRCRGDT